MEVGQKEALGMTCSLSIFYLSLLWVSFSYPQTHQEETQSCSFLVQVKKILETLWLCHGWECKMVQPLWKSKVKQNYHMT